jgi:hypothetical protein
MTEFNRIVNEFEQSGVDLGFVFIPQGDELIGFRREGERMVMFGDEGPKAEMFNRVFGAFREETEARVRAEYRAEQLAAKLRAAGIDPDA